MKSTPTHNAEALPEEKSAAPAASPPGKVVPLNAELKRPLEQIRVSGQTRIGFIEAVPATHADKAEPPGTADLLAMVGRTSQAFYEQKDAGKTPFMKWVSEEDRAKKAALIAEEIKASVFGPAPASPAAAKPAPRPQQPKGKDGRQASLPFEAARPPAAQAQAGNDPEMEPLEFEPRARLPIRDELLAMELPLYALAKTPDLNPRTFRRRNDRGQVTIIPSGCGPATVFDHDLVIYCASVIFDLLERGLAPSRTLVIDAADFFRKTRRAGGGRDYESVAAMLRRLCGTIIETDIETNGKRQTKGFGITEGYEILRHTERTGKRNNKKTGKDEAYDITSVLKFSLTLSEWQYNSLRHEANRLLAVDPAYFDLESATERRLYQIARHHCGKQPLWKIDIEHLADKVGTRRELRKFREDLRNAIRDDRLPGYHIALDSQAQPNWVVFYRKADGADEEEKNKINRARADALTELSRKGKNEFNAFEWFDSLERTDSKAVKPRASSEERKAQQNRRAAARKAAKQSVAPGDFSAGAATPPGGRRPGDE